MVSALSKTANIQTVYWSSYFNNFVNNGTHVCMIALAKLVFWCKNINIKYIVHVHRNLVLNERPENPVKIKIYG